MRIYSPLSIMSIIAFVGGGFLVVHMVTAATPNPGHNYSDVSGGIAQGDLLYGSATDIFSALAKSTAATRYLANTGANNDPAWAQVDLTNGVANVLPVSNGGTGVAALSLHGVVIGQGTSPVAVTNAGSIGQALLSNDGSGDPTFQQYKGGILHSYCIGTFPGSKTLYMPGFGGNVINCNDSSESSGMPVSSGTIKNLRVKCGAAFHTAGAGVFTIRKNSVNQAVTCTAGLTTSCADTSHSFTTVDGDVLTVAVLTGGGETGANCSLSIESWVP